MNYDGIITKDYSQSILHPRFFLQFNDLKWLNYFLFGFSIFELIFFMGFTLLSIIIVLYTIYICYKVYQILQEDNLNFDLDYSATSKLLQNVKIQIVVLILLNLVDIVLSKVFMSDYLQTLYSLESKYDKLFIYFSLFILGFRLIFMGLIWFLIRSIIGNTTGLVLSNTPLMAQ